MRTCLAIAGLALWTGHANASVIGFDRFSDSRQPEFLGHVEQGYGVYVSKGQWREALFFGSAAPSVFSRDEVGKLVVRAIDGTRFSAQSVDVGNGSLFSGAVKYNIRGVRSGETQFQFKGRVDDLDAFNTVRLDDTQVIDKLVIRLQSKGAASFNVDSIALTSAAPPAVIPLPSGIALLFGAGAVLFGLRRRG